MATKRSTAASAVIVLDSSDDEKGNDDDNNSGVAKSGDKKSNATSGRRAQSVTQQQLQPKQKAATAPAPLAAHNTSKSGNNCNPNKVKITKRNHSPDAGVIVNTAATRPSPPSSVSSPSAVRKVPPNSAAGAVAHPSTPRRIKPTLLSSTVSTKRPHLIDDSDDDDDDHHHYHHIKANHNDDDDRSTSAAAAAVSPAKKPRTGCDIQPASSPPTKTATSPAAAASAGQTAAAAAVAPPKTPITAAFAALLAACREAEPTEAMERLITRKLTRYYQSVHPEFVGSKSFSRAALRVATDIRRHPKLVYIKLENILEELRIRHKSGAAALAASAPTADADTPPTTAATTVDAADGAAATDNGSAATSSGAPAAVDSPDGGSTAAAASSSSSSAAGTGNARKDQQIKRLNHALYTLKKRIARLDEAEVDLDDEDNSTYLLGERYKKRAWEIYEKICDITGESKHACRPTRRPIEFTGTAYPLFNRTIQSFVNRTRMFPDLFDVRRCLEHCNQQYGFDLSKEEVRRVAQDAFAKIGKLLQRRRKLDLYETVEYFTEAATTTAAAAGAEEEAADGAVGPAPKIVDPAKHDVQLQRKLADNDSEYRRRMQGIIDRYAAEQDQPDPAKKTTVEGQPLATTAEPDANDASVPTSPVPAAEDAQLESTASPTSHADNDDVANTSTAEEIETIVPSAAAGASDIAVTSVSEPASPAAASPTAAVDPLAIDAADEANASCIIIDDD